MLETISLGVIREGFAELGRTLRRAALAGDAPGRRLHAICGAYLRFAHENPDTYRLMFGSWRIWAPEDGVAVNGELILLGSDSLHLLADTLSDCVAAGVSTSTDPAGDAVALWLGLHGLADQRAASLVPLGPPDLARRLVAVLAHLEEPSPR